MPIFTNAYATDGFCHNAQRGTFNHECGRPAVWIGQDGKGFAMGFCDHCRRNGHEARGVVQWFNISQAALMNARNVDEKTVAERKWQARKLAPKPQQPCDVGLFSDDGKQTELF